MIRGSISSSPVADVEISSLPPNQTAKAILKFLDQWLPAFRTEYLATNVSTLEDKISKRLHLYLQAKAKATDMLFHFNEKKGVDLLIFVEPALLSAKPIFMIEAKRLPSSNNGKQYVVGRANHADGIERFKCEQEGFVLERNQCAMVAYVQRHTFAYWFERINQWLTELISDNENYDGFDWEGSDKLVAVMSSTTGVARYVSSHSRKTLSRLTINHFWLDMCTDDPT